MFINSDYIELGTISEEAMLPIVDFIKEYNWIGEEYNRFEKPLVEGKLLVLPYIIFQPEQVQYTDIQKKILKLIEPVIDEVMLLFPNYIKVRGEIATLIPGSHLQLHQDEKWFHVNCRRIHVPIVTNEFAYQIFEDRNVHLEYSKIYEINNRILHSAVNNGERNRTHLILDLLPEHEYTEKNKRIMNHIVIQSKRPRNKYQYGIFR